MVLGNQCATGVLASVLAVMLSIGMGIQVTMLVSGMCYLALIPVSLGLISLRPVSITPLSRRREVSLNSSRLAVDGHL